MKVGDMPKQSKLKKTPNAAFLSWWEPRYFFTTGKHESLYRIYEELHGHGVDLNDIDMLSHILLLGDSITFTLNSSRRRPKRKHVRTKHPLPKLSDLHLSEVLALAEQSERRRKSLFAALGEADKMLHEVAQSFTRSPLLPALLEFHLLDLFRLSKVGQKSDSWGSFFLLLVTEYFKNELNHADTRAMAHGKAIQHYREADELLRACRIFNGQLDGSAKTSSKKRRKWTAAKRIEKLKKSHPNWLDTVVPILLQLQLIRNGESHRYRAHTRRFVERWILAQPLTEKFSS
jgi:hypothetical protein